MTGKGIIVYVSRGPSSDWGGYHCLCEIEIRIASLYHYIYRPGKAHAMAPLGPHGSATRPCGALCRHSVQYS